MRSKLAQPYEFPDLGGEGVGAHARGFRNPRPNSTSEMQCNMDSSNSGVGCGGMAAVRAVADTEFPANSRSEW